MMKTIYFLSAMVLLLFAHKSNAQCGDLFFSEYVEGSSNNKVLEIYNPGSAPVVLTGNYEIRRYSNGGLTPTSIALSGTINPMDVFVISNTGASAPLLAVSDQLSGNISHTGDDAYELYNISTASVIDVFGVVGNDPGTGWTVNGITDATAEHTLRRKPNVQSGNPVWSGSGENEWTVYNQNTFNYLTFHIMNSCAGTLNGSGSTANFCLNDVFSFTSTSANGTAPVNYTWEFGDGSSNVVNTQNGTYTYAAAGIYNITLLITDANNQVYAEVYTIEAYPAGPTACVSTSAMDGCGTDTLTISNCSSGGTGPLSYFYFFDNGNTSTLETPPTQYYTSGNYNAYMVVTDINGCDDTTAGTFSVSTTDDATFSYAQTVFCTNESNPIPNISGTPGGTFSCNGCVINAASGEIDLSSSSDGNYAVQYLTGGSCRDSSVFNITITSTLADASINAAGPFCESGSSVTLTAVTPGGIWSGNGIADANAGTFDPSLAGAGTHQIDYVISGACGNSSSVNIVVEAVDPSVITTSSSTLCNNETGANLLANAGGTWSGNFVSDLGSGLGFFNSASTPAGNYYAVYTMNDVCADKDSVLLVVAEAPVADFTYSVVGLSVQFTDASTAALLFAWEITEGSNVFTSTDPNPFYDYTDPSNSLDVCLTVTSSEGCADEYCEQILPTGLTTIPEPELVFYPNPLSNDLLHIAGLKNMDRALIRISNAIGQIVYTGTVPDGQDHFQISLAEQPAGTYFITISSNAYLITKKLSRLH